MTSQPVKVQIFVALRGPMITREMILNGSASNQSESKRHLLSFLWWLPCSFHKLFCYSVVKLHKPNYLTSFLCDSNKTKSNKFLLAYRAWKASKPKLHRGIPVQVSVANRKVGFHFSLSISHSAEHWRIRDMKAIQRSYSVKETRAYRHRSVPLNRSRRIWICKLVERLRRKASANKHRKSRKVRIWT